MLGEASVWWVRAASRWMVRRAMHRSVRGRDRNPDDPGAGRITRRQVRRILRSVWRHERALLPRARLERYPLVGNRINVYLAVLTLAAYRGLKEEGIPEEHAARLFADAGWTVYEAMIRPARWLSRLARRSPRGRMELILRSLMRFPFGQPEDPDAPGYRVEAWTDESGLHTHWTRCPPLQLVQALGEPGELKVFQQSWCCYDYPGAEAMVEGGRFRRTRVMSRGDEVCDMLWSVDEKAR